MAAWQWAMCRQMGISGATFLYVWNKKYGNLGRTELRELRTPREANAKLKRLMADMAFDKHILMTGPIGTGSRSTSSGPESLQKAGLLRRSRGSCALNAWTLTSSCRSRTPGATSTLYFAR
jgi:hypothetical protein